MAARRSILEVARQAHDKHWERGEALSAMTALAGALNEAGDPQLFQEMVQEALQAIADGATPRELALWIDSLLRVLLILLGAEEPATVGVRLSLAYAWQHRAASGDPPALLPARTRVEEARPFIGHDHEAAEEFAALDGALPSYSELTGKDYTLLEQRMTRRIATLVMHTDGSGYLEDTSPDFDERVIGPLISMYASFTQEDDEFPSMADDGTEDDFEEDEDEEQSPEAFMQGALEGAWDSAMHLVERAEQGEEGAQSQVQAVMEDFEQFRDDSGLDPRGRPRLHRDHADHLLSLLFAPDEPARLAVTAAWPHAYGTWTAAKLEQLAAFFAREGDADAASHIRHVQRALDQQRVQQPMEVALCEYLAHDAPAAGSTPPPPALQDWRAVERLMALCETARGDDDEEADRLAALALPLARDLCSRGLCPNPLAPAAWVAHARAAMVHAESAARTVALRAARQEGRDDVVPMLEAFVHLSLREMESLAPELEYALWRARRPEEAYTVALLPLHLPVGQTMAVAASQPEIMLRYGRQYGYRAIALCRQMHDQACLAFYAGAVGAGLQEAGETAEAVPLLAESCDCWLRLCDADFDRYAPALQLAAQVLITALSARGEAARVTDVCVRVLDLYRAAALRAPAAYAAQYAGMAWILADRLIDRDLQDPAIVCCEHVVTYLRDRPDPLPAPLRARLHGTYGRALYALGRFEEALAALEQALQNLRALPAEGRDEESEQMLLALVYAGLSLQALERHTEARERLREAARVRDRWLGSADRQHALRPVLSLGGVLGEAELVADAGACYEAVLQAAGATPDPADDVLRNARLGLARTVRARGDPQRALSLLAQVAVGGQPARAGATEAYVAFERCLAYQDLRQMAEAEQAGRTAATLFAELARAQPGRYLAEQARALSNYTMVLGALQRRQEALPHLRQAVALWRALAQAQPYQYTWMLIDNLLALSGLLQDVNEPGAWSLLEEAQTLISGEPWTGPRRRLAASWYVNIAYVQRRYAHQIGDQYPEQAEAARAAALQNLRRALSLAETAERLGDARAAALAAHAALAIGTMLSARAARGGAGADVVRTEAESALLTTVARYRALAARQPASYEPELANALCALGHFHWLTCGRRAEAEAAYQEAAELDRDNLEGARFVALSSLGYMHLTKEVHEPAVVYRYLGQALSELEQTRGRLRTQADFQHFGESYHGYYHSMLHVCHALQRPDEAWHWAERVKSRTLLDLLGDRVRPKLRDGAAAEAYEEWRAILDRYHGLDDDLPAGGKRGGASGSAGEERRAVAAAERAARARLLNQLEESRDLIEVAVPPAPDLALALRDLSAAPGERPLLLEYAFTGDDSCYAFALPLWRVTSGEPLPMVMERLDLAAGIDPAQRAALQARMPAFASYLAEVGPVRALLRLFAEAITQSTSGHSSVDVSPLFAALGALFVQPLEGILADLHPTTLIVVPHAWLQTLPVHALPLADGTPLIERFPLLSLPSASLAPLLLARARQRTPRTQRLVLGPPDDSLPSAAAEAKTLMARWDQQRPYQHAAMKVQVLRDHARALEVLHLATHSVFDRQSYILSWIAFHEESLTLLELLNDDTIDFEGMRLCYLSSCASALTQPHVADDAPGFVWALLRAGAEAVIGTLWPVSDYAARKMAEAFYREWTSGIPMVTAFQRAMLALRQDRFLDDNPLLWAPFVLAGNGFGQRVAVPASAAVTVS